MQSHPSWVRGLKLLCLGFGLALILSHPSWVRGLKQVYSRSTRIFRQSHPSWVRGLKLTADFTQLKGLCRTPRGCVD